MQMEFFSLFFKKNRYMSLILLGSFRSLLLENKKEVKAL